MGRFKKIVLIVGLVSIISSSWLYALLTKTDLENAHSAALSTLKSEEASLQQLSKQLPSDQYQSLMQEITDAQSSLAAIYTRASQYINPMLSLPDSARTNELINTQVSNAINQIQRTVGIVDYHIKQIQKQFGWQQQRQQNLEQSQLQSEQQRKAFEEMRVFTASLHPALVTYQQAFDQSRRLLLQINASGVYNAQDVQTVTDAFNKAAQQAKEIYTQSHKIPHFSNHIDLLSIILHGWIDFYIQLIGIQKKLLRRHQRLPSYYQELSTVAQRISGTKQPKKLESEQKGYNGVLQEAFSAYFKNEEDELNRYYAQRNVDNTYEIFRNGLAQIAGLGHDTAPVDTAYAQNIYTLLAWQASHIQQGQAALQAIQNDLALVYVNYATTILTKTMRAGLNNEMLRTYAIEALQQASSYFDQAQKASDASLYKHLASVLTQADNDIANALKEEKSGDQEKALASYTAALQGFKASGDNADIGFVNQKIADMTASANQERVQVLVKDFKGRQGNNISALLEIVTNETANQDLSQFLPTISEWAKVYQEMTQLYQQTISSYQQVLASQEGVGRQKTSEIVNLLTDGAAIVQQVSTGLALLVTVFQRAEDQLDSSLQAGELAYGQARAAFAQADALVQRDLQVAQELPLSFISLGVKDKTFTYERFGARYTALTYYWFAQQATTNTLLALHYYSYALQKSAFLSEQFISLLKSKLGSYAHQTQSVDDLMKNGQTLQAQANQLPASSWTSTGKESYTSDAREKWDAVLTNYWTAYQLGYTAAVGFFLDAVLQYAELYVQHVAAEYYPEAGASLIILKGMSAATAQGELQKSADLAKNNLMPLLKKFMNKGQELVNAVTAGTVSADTVKQLESLKGWNEEASYFLQQQQAILASYAPAAADAELVVMSQQSSSDGSIVYSVDALKATVSIPELKMLTAQIYQKLGDLYFSQQNYGSARDSYQQAMTAFLQLAQPTQASAAQNKYNVSSTLYYASYYYTAVDTGKDTTLLASLQVPHSYRLKTYALMVPDTISKTFPANLDQLKQDKQKLAQFEINVAAQTYLYYAIVFAFGQDRFNEIIGLVQQLQQLSDSQKRIDAIQASSLSSDEQTRLAVIVKSVESFKAELTERMNKGASNLVVEGLSAKNGVPQFRLWESYKPIPRFPLLPPPYQGYPDAYTYFAWAARLFGSDPITIGATQFIAGNQPEQQAQAIQEMVKVWLSQGYEIQQEINKIKQDPLFTQVARADKNDMNIVLKKFMPLYTAMHNLYFADDASQTSLLSSYQGPIGSNLVASGTPQYQLLLQLLAQTSKQAGDDIATFLVGDPLALEYSTVINDAAKFYTIAIESFGYPKELYEAVGELYQTAARIIQKAGNDFGSIADFAVARQFYKKIDNPPATIQQKLDTTLLEQMEAEFYGATNNAAKYRSQKISGIEVANEDGSKTNQSFDQLVGAYRTSGDDGSLSPAQVNAVEGLKTTLLNSLIFYVDCSSELGSIEATQNDDIIAQAMDLIHTFTDKNKLDVSTPAGMIEFMKREDFPLLIRQAFSDFMSQAQSADSKKSAVGKKAASLWSNHLYIGLGYIYMLDFFGGISADIWINLTAAIKAQLLAIQSDPSQYI